MTTDNIIEVIAVVLIIVYVCFNQKSRVSEWLILAVTNSEKELGGGTGQLKLRLVYDWFVSKFPILSALIPFILFSRWVNKAITKMKEMQQKNIKVATYIDSKPTETVTKVEVVAVAKPEVSNKEEVANNENNIQKQP